MTSSSTTQTPTTPTVDSHSFSHIRSLSSPPTTPTSSTRDLTDAQLKIFEICDKPLQTLPVSKDLPRLARKFSLIVDNQELDWVPPLSNEGEEDPESDGEKTVYHLLQRIHESIQQKQSTVAQFPSYDDFCNQVNMNDHVTINQFLLKNFGEKDAVTTLLKACHQTIVVHVLFSARATLMKQNIHFKDVRGAWKILIEFPKNDSQQQEQQEISSPGLISVTHKRREQVYMKFSDYTKHIEEYKRLHSEATDQRKEVVKSAFQQLFQFEWQIKIVYDVSEIMEMKVVRVDIELLDIVYENEDKTILDHPDWFGSTVESIQQCFETLDNNFAIRSNVFNARMSQRFSTSTMSPIAFSQSDESTHSSSGSMDENCTLLPQSTSATNLLPKGDDDTSGGRGSRGGRWSIWDLLLCWRNYSY